MHRVNTCIRYEGSSPRCCKVVICLKNLQNAAFLHSLVYSAKCFKTLVPLIVKASSTPALTMVLSKGHSMYMYTVLHLVNDV